MGTTRVVKESPVYQGEDEKVAYQFNYGGIGTPDNSPITVELKDGDGEDVSGSKLEGSASLSGDVVTCPKVIDLDPGVVYRLECQVVINGNTVERYTEIIAEE
jgi:hypothetical protein